MAEQKLKIAITGSIGSGKTLFASFIEEIGFTVIDADKISKELLGKDEKIKKEITKAFGAGSYVNGKPNLKYLAENVFSSMENVQKINAILHPVVIDRIEKKMDEELKKRRVVFVEAALIYEADMEDLFDYVVLVTADEDLRMARKKESKKISEEEFIKRSNNQIPDSEKRKRADFTFDNNATEAELKGKANLLLMMLHTNAVKK
ncbi:MAG: dephospho-CoA kinase [Ignavibacteriaceae bacterium]|nr:dephospho-CoA kinase [Ignavibacteriaceae bacterium]